MQMVRATLIRIAVPRRVVGYTGGEQPEVAGNGDGDGRGANRKGQGVVLDDGTFIPAKVVVLAAGYRSSWTDIISRTSVPQHLR